MVHDGFLKNT